MTNKIKVVYIFILSFSLLFFSIKTVDAQNSYKQNYDLKYEISENANTHASIDVKIENLSKTFFTSSYKLLLGIKDIQNFKVNSPNSEVAYQVESSPLGSNIILNFKDRIVGLNKILNFNISFDTSEITKNYNKLWEINIPGIENDIDSTYNVKVDFPKQLGSPTYVKPYLYTFASDSGELRFTKNELLGSGVSITFGDSQIYNLDLNYYLENKNLISVVTEISLPPNTNYQSVQIDSLYPKPINVVKDDDGNWLASYKLKPSQKLNVRLKGKVKTNLNPSQEQLSDSLKLKYLSAQKYWDTQDPEIINLAKKLKTSKAIYEYVVKKLNYDYNRLEDDKGRLGASKALKNTNSAVCLEFTDLFIAISRAAGIPAREVDGYAFTSNKTERPSSLVRDILHAWPEYYDFKTNRWIMIDPTWGNTTGGVDYFNVLDLDHITFAIKGVNSTYPIPAGGYKYNSSNLTKDINVTIGNKLTNNKNITAKLSFSNSYIAGFPISGKIYVTNNSNIEINNENLNVFTSILKPFNQNLLTKAIPPFGHEEININFDNTSFLTNSLDTIKISINNKGYQKQINIKPFFTDKNIQIGGVLIVIIGFIISIAAYGFRRLSISRRKK